MRFPCQCRHSPTVLVRTQTPAELQPPGAVQSGVPAPPSHPAQGLLHEELPELSMSISLPFKIIWHNLGKSSSKQMPDVVALSGTLFPATSCSEGKILPGTAQVAHTECQLKPQLLPSRGGSPSSAGPVTSALTWAQEWEKRWEGGRDRDRAQSRDEQLGVLRWLSSTQALPWRWVALLSTEPARVKFI